LAIEHSEALGAELEIGASLAVSGVCLTIIEKVPGLSTVELSPETLARTTLGNLVAASEVNLEPALRVGEPLGGHWVQGHVDSTLIVAGFRDLGGHREIDFVLPNEYRQVVVEKGSATIDGVSLTVARLERETFMVAVIPHSLEITTLGRLERGSRVNFEVDILAKYVQQVLRTSGVVAP
jgi:riboflavin synthase